MTLKTIMYYVSKHENAFFGAYHENLNEDMTNTASNEVVAQ